MSERFYNSESICLSTYLSVKVDTGWVILSSGERCPRISSTGRKINGHLFSVFSSRVKLVPQVPLDYPEL